MKWFTLIFFVLAVMVVAVPSLETHQFYGKVIWDVDANEPIQVVAEINTNEYTSEIRDVVCGDVECIGLYGQDEDNILRVQGSNGDIITLFVDGLEVQDVTYSSDAVTVKDFNVTQAALDIPDDPGDPGDDFDDESDCVEDYLCGSWSTCILGSQLRSCLDRNECDVNSSSYNETQVCGGDVAPVVVTCEYDWKCTAWSVCSDSSQERTCERVDACDTRLDVTNIVQTPQPAETKSCSAAPAPVLGANTPPKEPNVIRQPEVIEESFLSTLLSSIPWLWVIVGLVGLVVLGSIGVAVYFLVIKKPKAGLDSAKKQQLSTFFKAHMKQGQSKIAITDSLVKGGWDRAMVNKFVRDNKL